MIALKVAAFLLLGGPLREPDCQRFCLGVCHYDRAHRRCADTRVEYIGEWDPVPEDYEPKKMYEFQVNALGRPPAWGYFRTEMHLTTSREDGP